MARFFIDRPIFAWVIAILIMLVGSLSIFTLPIAQYPAIAPPAISIVASYPGASAQAIENTVTQIIEQEMKGVDNLIYMASSSESTGAATVTMTFEAGTDPDIAQMQVQNKLQLATPLLPEAVQRQGLQVSKSVKNFLMIIAFVSTNDSMSAIDLGDYVATHVEDPISRLEGVGDVTLFESEYAMRIWIDPYKLREYELTPLDVKLAIQAENAEITAGQLGATPAVEEQPFNVTVNVQNRLRTPEEFGAIFLKTDVTGASVRLHDVARLEIGAENYEKAARLNGNPAAGMAVKLSTNANALDTAEAINAKLAELSKSFPQGMETVIAYDSTPFISISINNVVKTLLEAVVLVFIVMYLFMQNFRATLIPTIAVPVVLLGTFGVLAAFGYTINTLTLFAMVLAIGLLVDDAIVVVENVERLMHEEGLSAKVATQRSMDQITGALVGIALVLSAVFLPMAFFPGSAGVIYQQFSVTIVSAMILSVIVAIVLSPALCATLLKPDSVSNKPKKGFFAWFNRLFNRATDGYVYSVNHILTRPVRFGIIYLLLVAGAIFLYITTPTGFLPDEDQGTIFSQVMLPPGSTQEQTLKVLKQLEAHYLEHEAEAVEAIVTVAGFNFSGTGQNTGLAFIRLKDWSKRLHPDLTAEAIVGRAMQTYSKIKEARVVAFGPPAVAELGNSEGFDVFLQDVSALGRETLVNARNQLLGMAGQAPSLMSVRPNGHESAPILNVKIDRQKIGAYGLSLTNVNDTLSAAWGSSYVDDFINQGNVKKVYLQSDTEHRMIPSDLNKWTVRNKEGAMVELSAVASTDWGLASPKLERYNGLPAVELLGESAPGWTSGQAMTTLEHLSARLPDGLNLEWTGLSYEERSSGQQALALYGLLQRLYLTGHTT